MLMNSLVYKEFMDWNIIIGIIGIIISAFIALMRKTIYRMAKMLDDLIEQHMIKKEWIPGDFPMDVLLWELKTDKKIGDSDWGLKILHPKKSIKRCRIKVNGKWLLWDNEHSAIFIMENSAKNLQIREDDYPKNEDARIEVWDGNKILIKEKFSELPILRE